MAMAKSPKLHIAMFPWFAFGHMIPYLNLSNELAGRGHKITFILPRKAQSKLQHLNFHPALITFHPLIVPHVDGLPPGTETASDIPVSLTYLLATALDRTRDQVEAALRTLNPDLLFYDFAYWAPALASQLGIKSIYYCVVCAAAVAHTPIPAQQGSKDCRQLTDVPPPGYPSSTVVLRPHEARLMDFMFAPYGEGITFQQRHITARTSCDAISIRTCQETEGPICDYIGSQYGKPVFLTGPVLPNPSVEPLEDRWAQWLGGFKPGSVIFCAFGSQNVHEKDQFQELLLGLELTGLPFFAALKPPTGAATIEEALPRGSKRGLEGGDWFMEGGGCSSRHDPQIVLVPELPDQILNSRLLAEELKVAVEVEREENGLFSKESLCDAIKTVMDENSEVGGLVKKNHAKWKEALTSQSFLSNYVDNFHGLGEWGWLCRHGGGFQRANLPSRLSETPSYLPESLAEPQLLRILSRDGELRGCRGRDALQLSWVQLAGVSGGYGARNGFRRAKRGRFSSRGWGSSGIAGLAGGDEDSGRKKIELDDLEGTVRFAG
ncbi:UDP-glycosyltransferase 79B9 [Vitis vinifera]|uniref:UDP-glycosyltransferase 79B9 n=1 Tax=Vitis vinifera TaxID=29760 RepID=A0A438BSV3_VITVI|nr:UDP-glycosyltransferase 79B9 [Vitis vinifera]